MKTDELEKIKNHIDNLPSVSAMYVPELIKAVESLNQQLEVAHAFHDLVVKERDYLSKQVKELDAVRRAAADWIDRLEAKGGHYNDGVPGELMDALERSESWKIND